MTVRPNKQASKDAPSARAAGHAGIRTSRLGATNRSPNHVTATPVERPAPGKWVRLTRQLGRRVLDLTLPSACCLCDLPTNSSSGHLCPSCRAILDDNFRQTFCARCGATTGPFAGQQGGCALCHAVITPLAGVIRLGSHVEAAAELVRAYKYGGQSQLESWFAELLAMRLLAADWWSAVDAIAPVPTCWSRRLRGGKHVATPLARAVASCSDKPCLPLLRRIRGGPSQIGLSQHQRMQNVRNKFNMQRGVSLQKATVCLIDDVSTTGATLFECARILKRGGASAVYAAFLCKASSVKATT